MIVDINVTKDFVNQRDARAEKYNPRGRSLEQLKLDIECEIFEWWMIDYLLAIWPEKIVALQVSPLYHSQNLLNV